jgi:hypothetical protein
MDNIKVDLPKWDARMDCTALTSTGKVAWRWKSGNDPSGFMKCGKVFE